MWSVLVVRSLGKNFGTKNILNNHVLWQPILTQYPADHAGRHRFDFIAQRVRAERAEREARAVTRWRFTAHAMLMRLPVGWSSAQRSW